MNRNLIKLLARLYRKPVDDEGNEVGGGAAVDRGDDHVATDDDEDPVAAALAAAAAKSKPAGEKTAEEIAIEGLAAGKDAHKTEKTPEELEAEATAEAAAAAAGGKGKDTRIPLNRHTEILGRERAAREAAELEVQRLREGAKVAKTNEELTAMEEKVSTLETQYTEAMADGKTKEAAALMKEIRTTERTIIEQKAAFNNQVATAQAVEQVRFDTVVERLEEAYPQIRPGSDEYDKDIVAEVLDMQSAWVAKGYAPSAALQKAVGYILKPATTKQETATTATPRVDAEAATAAAAAARATDQRKKNADASEKQPPNAAKIGANADAAGGVLDAKTAIKMPYDKFVKLDEDDLSRMRGDTI